MLRATHLLIQIITVTCVTFSPLPSRADAAGTSFCAQLSSESVPVCVTSEQGVKAAWDQAAAKWKPGPIPSAPVVAIWAEPGVGLDDLAMNKNGMLTVFNEQVGKALDFAKGKNAESFLSSMKAQKVVLDEIAARQAELKKGS